MNWLILTIVSAVTLALSRVLQRIMLKDVSSDSFTFSFIFPFLVSLIILAYAILTGTFAIPDLSPVWVNMVIMIIFYGIGSVCVYQAYKESPASEVSIIFASSSAWSVIAAMFFLGERLTSSNIIGVLTIILGVVTVNYQRSKWQIERGHLYALLGALMFGFGFINDAFIITAFSSVPSYVFLAFILPTLAILLYRPSLVKGLPHYFSKEIIGKLFFTSAIYAISSIAIYAAYKAGGKASIISPIQQSNVVITVILSYFLLNEKDKLSQKIVGAILVFGGALLLL